MDLLKVGIHPSCPGQRHLHPSKADLYPGSDSGHLSQRDTDHGGCRAGTPLVSQPQTGLAELPWGDRLPSATKLCQGPRHQGYRRQETLNPALPSTWGPIYNQGPSEAPRPGRADGYFRETQRLDPCLPQPLPPQHRCPHIPEGTIFLKAFQKL